MSNPGTDAGRTDDGGNPVSISEWDAVREHLERFCAGGSFSMEDECAVCEFPNARIAVGQDGTVETGMPLHAFERENVERLLFDHDTGELTVTDDQGLHYVFRRP